MRPNHTTTGLAFWSSLTLETTSHPWVLAGHPHSARLPITMGMLWMARLPPRRLRNPLRTLTRLDCNNTTDVLSSTLRIALSTFPFVCDLCGVDVHWRADAMECYIFLRNIFKIACLMGRFHTKDVLGNISKDHSFRLVHWLSFSLSLRITSRETIHLQRKSYLYCSLDTLCTRGEFGRVT